MYMYPSTRMLARSQAPRRYSTNLECPDGLFNIFGRLIGARGRPPSRASTIHELLNMRARMLI